MLLKPCHVLCVIMIDIQAFPREFAPVVRGFETMSLDVTGSSTYGLVPPSLSVRR